MKIKIMLYCFMLILIFSGCTTTLRFTDLSKQEGYNNWIGKEFVITGEALVIYDDRFNIKFINGPDRQSYPTIEEYRTKGYTKKHWTSNESINRIAEVGEKYKIISISTTVYNRMIGERGIIAIENTQDGKRYYLQESDMFSFDGKSISLNDGYLKLTDNSTALSPPAPQPAPDEKAK